MDLMEIDKKNSEIVIKYYKIVKGFPITKEDKEMLKELQALVNEKITQKRKLLLDVGDKQLGSMFGIVSRKYKKQSNGHYIHTYGINTYYNASRFKLQ